jgi:hypothetical protein
MLPMHLTRKIIIALLALLILIQFFRPETNASDVLITENDISRKYIIPEETHQILIKKCYDCHSNTSHYPWYFNVQPVGWWMAHHIDEGKEELNFSTFKTYPEKRANHKLEEISEAVNEGWMPLDSYVWMHHDARITSRDRDSINAWIKNLPAALTLK